MIWCLAIFAWAGNWDLVFKDAAVMPPFPIDAYSEFTPALSLGPGPYPGGLEEGDYVGRAGHHFFKLSRIEEVRQLRPGLNLMAQRLTKVVQALSKGHSEVLPPWRRTLLDGNPYWGAMKTFPKHPLVGFVPLVMSRTMQELGRFSPWTVYGNAEVPWEDLFFQFYDETGLCRILSEIYAVKHCDLSHIGFRVFSRSRRATWWESYRWSDDSAEGTRYLLTFEPWRNWPKSLQEEYLRRGNSKTPLFVFPHPSSLIFSHAPFFERLAHEVPSARELPLALVLGTWAGDLDLGPMALKVLGTDRKTHRFMKTRRPHTALLDGDELLSELFGTGPTEVGLYDKPSARNRQMWGVSGPLAGQWVLTGGETDREALFLAKARIIADNGQSQFQYRTYYPPMQIGKLNVKWYRPLVLWSHQESLGHDLDHLGLVRIAKTQHFPVELSTDSFEFLSHTGISNEHLLEASKLNDFSRRLGTQVSIDLATGLLLAPEHFEAWMKKIPLEASRELERLVGPREPLLPGVTFSSTATDRFEIDYWKHLVWLTDGPFTQKNNADCSQTNEKVSDPHCKASDLDVLAVKLKEFHERSGLPVVSHLFRWESLFDYSAWSGFGERQQNVIAVIHGKDNRPHDEVIILADHYDTAYMEDAYHPDGVTPGHRHASKGADDNHSATAVLLGASVLNQLPLKKDIWLVHLTGEEFPADCLGARQLARAFIEGQPLVFGRKNPKVSGIFVMDMIGHSTDRDHRRKTDVFQLSPGRGKRAAALAQTAFESTRSWNAQVEKWNQLMGRRKPWKRYAVPQNLSYKNYPLPELSKFIPLRAEVRPHWHPKSSLYNTDPQVLSDAGLSVVLIMENYDLARKGYHDSLDNLENIDLDYARAIASIAIETVAREAMKP